MAMNMSMNGSSSNSTAATCDLPFASSVATATINSIFCLLGIIGNFLVYLAVYKTSDLRTLGNAYLVVLAGADFLTSAIAQPLLIVMVIQEASQKCDETLEIVFRVVGNFSCAVSFLVLCFITTERFLAVVKPLGYKTFHPKRRFCVFTTISLILPLIYTILRLAVSKKGTSYFSAILFVIGYIYIISCYLAILVQLRRQSHKMAAAVSSGKKDTRLRHRAEKVVTSTMLIVICIFTVMWVPFFYFRVSQPSTNSGVAYNWVRTTAISNSALNPIIYALRMEKFNSAFKRVVTDGFQSIFSSRTTSTSN